MCMSMCMYLFNHRSYIITHKSILTSIYSIIMYSNRKCLQINYDKTKYLHFSDTPILDDININDDIYISVVNPSDGYIRKTYVPLLSLI